MPTYSSKLKVCTSLKDKWPAWCRATNSLYMPTGDPPVAKPKTLSGFSCICFEKIVAATSLISSYVFTSIHFILYTIPTLPLILLTNM